MFSKKTPPQKIAPEEHELLENAQKRIRQKKRLYYHFVFFLVGSVFLIIVNKVLGYGEPYDWFVWAIFVWFFLLVFHFFNVFVTHRFMGKEWERKQREKLVALQKAKIAHLQKELDKTITTENPPKEDML